MTKEPLKIVIADDNRFFCDALKDSLNIHDEFTISNTFTSLDSLISFTNNSIFDILILDVNFNGLSSLDFIHKIKNDTSDFKIIALTTMNNNFIKEKALNKGVDYFIGKDSDLSNFKEVILNCYKNDQEKVNNKSFKISIGNLDFTKRKLEVLEALYNHSDKKEKELSKILNISESSLKSHKRELFEITNTKNTPELLKFGIQNGLIVF
ncbi:DNA-binding NarL/FixJ family response regulator [Lutibacter sp. Hel_I_33_5]|uniref:response regulator transcription factor n=1 Tax=Lutibacter sp. Hel_I_33_5 TaxID=1566289 RepID=UPI0011A55B45|nr:response regulator transcription factor [Lutibacter sp. Hel_I_33_5]TVZ54833.1 DNA-binding NarL/FixJ family response regulator [Lutibacter sp. Hel_I_33_5]